MIGNCYFTFGNSIFSQIIEILMVSHPTPFMANLFLYYFDNNWSWNLHKTWKIANTFCFIDDVSAVINNGLFEKYFKEIYHDELELKKEKISITKISFLDIDLVIKEKKVLTKFLIQGTLSHFKLSLCLSLIAIYPLNPLLLRYSA